MKKTWFKALTLLILLAFVTSITGCNSNPVEAEDEAQTNKTVDNEPVEKIDLNGDTIRISMWWDGAPTDENGKTHIRSIEEKYNCRIEYVNIPFDLYLSKFNASILSGEPIADLAYMEAVAAIPAMVEAGTIIPVDDYFDFNDPKWPSILRQTGRYAGKQYGFNNTSWDAAGIYYNKVLIEQAGVPEPFDLQEKGEWTWEAFLETAKAATMDTDGDGKIDKWGLAVQLYNLYQPLILSNNADIIKTSDEGENKFVLDTPEGIEALQFMSDLYNKHKVVMPYVEEYDWYEAPKSFAQGKVAMFFGQPWDGIDFKNTMQNEYGFVLFPRGPKAKENIVPIGTESKIYVMPKGAKHPYEAAQIFEELYSFNKELDKQSFMRYMSDSLWSDKYLSTVDKMIGKGRVNLHFGFHTFGDSFSNFYITKVIKGNTPADVFIKETKEEMQKAIDEEFN